MITVLFNFINFLSSFTFDIFDTYQPFEFAFYVGKDQVVTFGPDFFFLFYTILLILFIIKLFKLSIIYLFGLISAKFKRIFIKN